MNRSLLLAGPLCLVLVLPSCVSKKKYAAIRASNETLLNKLNEANDALST